MEELLTTPERKQQIKTYNVFKHPRLDIVEAVKVGFSWPALFFNFFWMLSKRLWMHAGLYMVAAIVMSNLDKVANKTNSEILDTFMLISYVAMLLVPGFIGNKLLDKKFKTQGYEFLESIQAEAPKAAIEKASDKFIEVLSTLNPSEFMVSKSILESEEVPFRFSGGNLNPMGLLSDPVKLYVPIDQKEKALLLLKQVEDFG